MGWTWYPKSLYFLTLVLVHVNHVMKLNLVSEMKGTRVSDVEIEVPDVYLSAFPREP